MAHRWYQTTQHNEAPIRITKMDPRPAQLLKLVRTSLLQYEHNHEPTLFGFQRIPTVDPIGPISASDSAATPMSLETMLHPSHPLQASCLTAR